MDARYAAAFAGHAIVPVRTLTGAGQALAAQRVAPVAVGVYFDDSRMFDLVRAIRAGEAQHEVPILCVRGRPGFTAIAGRTLEMTVKALAADAFVDLLHFKDEAAGDAALRAAAAPF